MSAQTRASNSRTIVRAIVRAIVRGAIARAVVRGAIARAIAGGVAPGLPALLALAALLTLSGSLACRSRITWTDAWTAPDGYSDALTEIGAGRLDEGERRVVALTRRFRSIPWESRAWFALGCGRLKHHDYEKAERAFERAGARDGPLAPFAALKRAEALLGRREFAKAIAAVELAARAGHDAAARAGNGAALTPTLTDDIAIVRARAMAGRDGSPQGAVAALLTSMGSTPEADRASLLEAAAQIAESGGDRAAAIDLNRRLYLEEPRRREAAAALDRLSALATAPERFRTGDFDALERRARTLIEAGDGKGALATWDEAVASVPSLLADPQGKLAIAEACIEAKQHARALVLLGRGPARAGDTRRALLLGRALFGVGRSREALGALKTAAAGTDERAAFALFLYATGLDQNDRDREALDAFRAYLRRFQNDERTDAALWRSGWLAYRLGRRQDADTNFAQLARMPEAAAYHPSALYWLGRIREAAGLRAQAADFYARLVREFTRDYYGLAAASRLASLNLPGARTDVAPGITSPIAIDPLGKPPRSLCEPAGSQLVRSGCELEAAGQMAEAERGYLRAAQGGSDRALWLRLSDLATRRADRPAALERIRFAAPDYLALPIAAMPMRFWELLYPRPNKEALAKAAHEEALDPALISGLILQESAFNPLAMSGAGAIGLMQVLPGTGGDAARALGIRNYTPARLVEPETNLRIGAWHFARVLERFGGRPPLALAAYNAGEARVNGWITIFGTPDTTVFVEEIPFTETRLYVKRILSHAAMYKAIYGS